MTNDGQSRVDGGNNAEPHGMSTPPPPPPMAAPNGTWDPAAGQQSQPPRRSVPKLVFGIILTVIGGLALLGRLGAAASGAGSIPSDPAEAAGYLTGALLFTVVPLGIGVLLLVTSSRKS